MPDRPTNPDKPEGMQTNEGRTDNSVLIGIALAAVVAVLILFGSTIFNSDQKGVDVTATQPTTESPTPTKSECLTVQGVGFGRRSFV